MQPKNMQANSKVQADVRDKLLYVDDLAGNAKTETKMQGAVGRMAQACDNFDHAIRPYSEPTIYCEWTKTAAS